MAQITTSNMSFKKTMIYQSVVFCLLVQSAIADDLPHQVLPQGQTAFVEQVALLSPEQIEQKLQAIDVNAWLDTSPQPPSTISYINDGQSPIGLDVDAVTRLPTLQTLNNDVAQAQTPIDINPQAYIPEYQQGEMQPPVAPQSIDEPKQAGVIQKLYNRLFNDGVERVPMVKAHLYHAPKSDSTNNANVSTLTKIDRKTSKQEPYANIRAALQDMTAQSVADFRGATPRIRQAINAAAKAVGYYEMDFSVSRAAAGEVNVVIHSLGKPVIVDNHVLEIRGEGADNLAYERLIKNIDLKQGDIFHHGDYETTKAAIDDVSGEEGYFDSKWLSNSVDVILPDNIADVSLVYDTGKQYAFDEVVFFTFDPVTKSLTTDPDKLPVKPELLKKLVTFNMGDAYNRTATRNLSNSLLATGYFNAVNTEVVLPSQTQEEGISFEQSLETLEQTKEQANEVVDLGDGVLADIAPLEFTTSQVVADKLALVAQKAEQLYNAPEDRLLITDDEQKSKNILGRISDAVSHIAKLILPDESSDALPKLEDGQAITSLSGRKTGQEVYQDKKVPLYVFVMSDKPRDAELGVGWGSDSGTRFITKFNHNLINKKGMQAGADIRWSENEKGIDTYITRPITHPLNDKLRGNLSYKEESVGQGVGNFALSAKTLETGLSRNRIKDNGYHRTYSLRYRLDELETHAPRETWKDLPVQFLNGKPTQEALLAGYAISKTVADNVVNPMRGYRQHYSLELGAKGVLTDANMAITKLGVSGVYSFGDNLYGKDRAHQLLGGINAGYIWTKDFDAVPYKLRFFAGGDQSIRGYSYQSLSPLSNKGYLTGGQALAAASGEYNYEVIKDVRLGVFADVGNAYDKQFKNDTKIGAGLGVRWASPVGQVRIDIAKGINEEKSPIKLHFFIGTPF